MRVLLIMPDPPLPFYNAASRWYFALTQEFLQRTDLQVMVAYAAENSTLIAKVGDTFAGYDALHGFLYESNRGLFRRLRTWTRPFSYVYSDQMIKFIAERSRSVDVIHGEQIWTGYAIQDHNKAVYNLHYLPELDANPDVTGVAASLARSRVIRAQDHLIRKMKKVVVASQKLESLVSQKNSCPQICKIPLGLDLTQYPKENNVSKSGKVGLIGNMHWEPGRTAALHFARLARQFSKMPGIDWRIAGFHSESLDLGDDQEFVTIDGEVSDPLAFIQGLACLVYLPERGSGMKIKVMEAMALGTPVITNIHGAEGLETVVGPIVTTSEAEVVEEITKVLEHDGYRDNIIRRQRVAIESLAVPELVSNLVKFYQRVVD